MNKFYMIAAGLLLSPVLALPDPVTQDGGLQNTPPTQSASAPEESALEAARPADFSELIEQINKHGVGTTVLSLKQGGGTIVHEFDNTREDTPQIRWVLWANGRRYVTQLALERIQRTPRWDPAAVDGAENPPLSARTALEKATDAIKQDIHPFGDGVTYRTPVLKLQQFERHWFWVVYFTPENFGMVTRPFPVVVLMDGSVLRPTSGPNADQLQDAKRATTFP